MGTSLKSLGEKHGTDKASLGYLGFYERHFKHWKDERIRLLELGILKGASLRMWREWFTKAEIIGADIAKSPEIKGVVTHVVDLETIDDLKRFATNVGQLDVILDDAGHTMEQQQNALSVLWNNVKNGGAYVIEDLESSLIPNVINKYTKKPYNVDDEPTTLDLVNAIHGGTDFSSRWLSVERFRELTAQVERVELFHKPNGKTASAILWKRTDDT